MSQTIFITGGARSGKSRFAEQITHNFGAPLCYLATAQPLDDEMDHRIAKHQQRRGDAWHAIEEPLQLAETLANYDGTYNAVLIDCLTLWLSNLLMLHEYLGAKAEERILEDVQNLAETLRGMTTPVVIVSNEVGMGIVPDNEMARMFRDHAGTMNRSAAEAADRVYLLCSGIPVRIK